jgi:zinc protease
MLTFARTVPVALSLCLLWAQPRTAAADADPGALPYQSFVLPNGLKVLVHEDHTVPLVAVEVYYHVGSKDEAPGKTGFAHLFEHLMFKGSRNVPDGGHFKAVLEAGGTCNATTNRDRTNYFEVVPSSFLSRALFLEADRMAHLLDGITQASLDNQRDVVRNERRQNYENRPYGSATRPLYEALYPVGHPYHWLTIGDHADLERASLADVRNFFRTHYRPGNATLAIAGDVDLATAKQLVEQHFGAIPSDPKHPDHPPSNQRSDRPPPGQVQKLTAEKRIEISDAVSLERVTFAWPSPAAFQPGDADLDLLTALLGPNAGRLHKRLVHETQIAQSVAVGQVSGLLASNFEITVLIKPGHTAHEVTQIVDEELAKIVDGRAPITAAELEDAKTRTESDVYYDLMSLGGNHGGRSGRLLYYDYLAWDPGYLARDLQRYRDASATSVQNALRDLGKNRVVLIVQPKKKVEVAR